VQGILSVQGIAGYDRVPARIGRFCCNNSFFIIPTANGEPSFFLMQNFLLHKIWVALKSLWSFCDLVATSNINNELKSSAPH
jgi:hypothetical protein